MSEERYKPQGEFVGFKLDLGGDRIPVLKERKPGKPLLKLSPSRVITAAKGFFDNQEIPDPKEIVLPPAVAAERGRIAHLIKLATDISRSLRPRNPRGYREEYLHRVDHEAPIMMPNLPNDTVGQITTALKHPGVPMPHTTSPEHANTRLAVDMIIARALIAAQKELPPFTGNESLDDDLFPHPSPANFCQAWEEQGVDDELLHIAKNMFEYTEQHKPPIDGVVNRNIMVTAGELKIRTFIPRIRAIFTTIVDLVRFGYQDPGENHRPHNIITRHDWKTGQPVTDELFITAEECDYVVAEMLAAVPRDVPTRRIGIQVERALDGINSNTAVVTNYVGFGTRSQWTQTSGSPDYPLNANRDEAVQKRLGFENLILTIINERPDLMVLFQ